MKIIKKIFSLLVISSLFFGNSSFAAIDFYNSYDSNIENTDYNPTKDVILSKNKLLKIKSGDKYVKSIDEFIEKYKNNEDILIKLKTKVFKAQQLDNSDKKSKNMLIILNYLSSKINLALYNLDIQKKKEESEAITKAFENKLSEDEKKKVSDEILKLQINILNKGLSGFEKIRSDFEKMTNYEEKGNLALDMNFNMDDLNTLKAKILLNDYIGLASSFDSRVMGNLDSEIETTSSYEGPMNLKFKGYFDFIQKNASSYLLVKDFSATYDENNEVLKSGFDMIKKISDSNKYVSITDKNTEMIFEMINSYTPEIIISKLKNTFSKPMFEAYKKTGDKYLLIPTKYACEKMMELDGYSSCDDETYKDLLVELYKTGELYLIIGDNTTFGFQMNNKNDNIVDISGNIVFSPNYIEEINFNLFPKKGENNYEKPLYDGLTLKYKRNDFLNFKLYAGTEIDVVFDAKLDINNKFSYINHYGKIYDGSNKFDSEFKLENNKINGKISYVSYEDVFKMDLNGNTDSYSKLENLSINYNLKNSLEEILSGKFNYSSGNFSFENNYKDDYLTSKITISGLFDTINKVLKEGNLLITSKIKKYNYDTWDYSTDYNSEFSANYNLKNEIITGNMIYLEDKNEILNIQSTGKYNKDNFELNNTYKLDYNDMGTYLGNLNFSYLKSSLSNNVNLYFNLKDSIKEIVKFDLKSTFTITKKDIKIEAPTNTVDFKDL